MVKVEFRLGKRDFVWIGLIVVLLGVGFVYGFGGVNPSVMGHSADEIEGVATLDYVDNAIVSAVVDISPNIILSDCEWTSSGGCVAAYLSEVDCPGGKVMIAIERTGCSTVECIDSTRCETMRVKCCSIN